jgi:3-methyladenine DNA glycosylase AlkD
MPCTPLAATIMRRLTETYGAARDPDRAGPMFAYMRGQFPFLGITAPDQRMLARDVMAGLPRPAQDDLHDVALACWGLPEREYQYFATRLLRRYVTACGADFLDTVRGLITTKPWWDTVDELAVHVVGPLVTRFPYLVTTMDAWSVDCDPWLIRTAILHQLRYRGATDKDRLFRYCAGQAGHADFFVRKAIGWALREFARTDPDAVRAFVAEHRESLSGLSVREALRHL